MRWLRRAITFLDLIKFQHTAFALPFAVLSAFLAARGFPGWRICGWALLAMVGARSAAMAFNRLVDERYDRANPRTADRHLPRGVVSRPEVGFFMALSIGAFVIASWQLNPLCLALSPVALLVILGYSFSKRFTSLSHVWLGLALSIGPVGAWLAVTGMFAMPPLWLALAVVLWTAGFDMIYACQDVPFDRATGLYSVPALYGVGLALKTSAALHLLTVPVLGIFLWLAGLSVFSWGALLGITALLIYEHRIVQPDDLSRVNTAFFTVNAVISFGLMAAGLLDLFLLAK